MLKAILTVAIVTSGNSLDIEKTEFSSLQECKIAQELIEAPLEFFGYDKTFTYERPFVTLNVFEHPTMGTEVSVKCKEVNNNKGNSSWTTTTNAVQQTAPAVATNPAAVAASYLRSLSALLPSF